jgi:hypothetical protein
MLNYLSQRDPKWANNKIGSSYLTIGKQGCTLTSVSMLSDLFGQCMFPDAIASHKDWFTSQGLIIWTKLAIPGLAFQWRQYGRNDTKILAALKNPNAGVLLQVGSGSHWVVATKKVLFKNSYWCIDPWQGDVCDVIKRYKNITGSAFFSKGVK